MTFTVTPIGTDAAIRLRERVQDGSLPARAVVLDEPGAPCRQCLRAGQAGDEMLLFTFQPFGGESPYAVPSPVFIHSQPCASYAETDRLPEFVRSGTRAVRSYNAGHDLVDGEVVPGAEVETSIARLFKDPSAAYLHVHSATAGCFTFRVDRA